MSRDKRLGCAALLAGLPGIGPARLRALLDREGPEDAWRTATSGRALHVRAALGPTSLALKEELIASWARVAADPEAGDPVAVAQRHADADVRILLREDPAFPAVFRDDLSPPPVLFVRGDTAALEAPRVAIVGTRRCTGSGAAVARELGRELSARGIAVVSGLALGIDGAAHRGVLDHLRAAAGSPQAVGRPIGVIGSGHDRPYPLRHRDLWSAVAERGLLLGETPLGVGPATWRFPLRNRLIAAAADLLVVVESHVRGGSLHTVREASDRDIDVMAVPGSVRSPAAAGTNQLLAEGCHPVRDVDDVLVALGLVPGGRRRAVDGRPAPDPDDVVVLEAFDWEPATLEHLALRTGRGVPALALALHRLEAGGWVASAGPWYERVAAA